MSNSEMPDPETIKALALDLDGTILAPGGVLTERTVRTFRAAAARGVRLILATGRALEAAEKYRLSLGAEGPMVYFNGAVVADMPGGQVLNAVLLAKEAVEFCTDLSRRRGAYFQVFFPGTETRPGSRLLAEKAAPERDLYHGLTGLLAELGDLKEALAAPGLRGCIKSMFLAEPEEQAPLRAAIEERFGRQVYVTQTRKNFLEVMDARVSKGEGLRRVMEYRGLDPAQVIALGDEENDIPMFAAAGFSAAPANAKAAVKAAASLVIGSNAEEGAAVFVEDFFGL